MEAIARTSIVKAVEGALMPGVRRATVYQSAKLTVKATRQRKPDGRDRQVTLLLTCGSPNYAERQFIKDCKEAGEPLPVRRVQLKGYPKK